jgi:two-component system sensor histidine kinase BarA
MFSFFLKFSKRFHYLLVGLFLLLLILLILLGYTKYKINNISVQLFEQNNKDLLLRDSYLSLLKSQTDFNLFLKTQNGFETYIHSLQKVDSIFNIVERDAFFSNEILLQDRKSFHQLLQTISNYNSAQNKTDYIIPVYDFKDVLNSIQVESSIKVDSVAKKGLFSRIGDALKDDVQIQKEQLNVVVSMKYGKKIVTGSIEDQLSNVFKSSIGFYSRAISDLESHYNSIYQANQELISLQEDIFKRGTILFDTCESILKDNEQFLDNELKDLVHQSTFLIIVIFLLFLLIILFFVVQINLNKV